MDKRIPSAIVIGCIALLLVFGAGLSGKSVAFGQTNIRFSTWHVPVGYEVKTVWEPMLEQLKKKSNGKISYAMYPGGALGKGPEHYDIVAKGLSDMGYFTATWQPGKFPLTDVLSLAAWVDGKDIATEIGNAMYKRVLNQEFQGVKMVELNGCIQAFIWTKKPVKSLEDLKGMKIAVSGATMVKVGRALGLSPVTMSTGDLYEAADKGVIDGFVRPVELLVSRKLAEVAKYVTDVDLGHDLFFIVMNQKKWDSLPPDAKKVLTELSGDWAVEFTGKAWDKFDQEAAADVKAKGIEFISLPKQEEARWRKLISPIKDEYAADLEAKKLPGKKILEELKKLAEKKG